MLIDVDFRHVPKLVKRYYPAPNLGAYVEKQVLVLQVRKNIRHQRGDDSWDDWTEWEDVRMEAE